MNNQFYESLKKNILFKNTDITSLNLDEIKGRLVRVGEGEIVYREGAPSDFIFLVVSGQVNIIKKKVLGKAKSYIYNENDFFGNDEYFEETTRTATAIALIDSYLIVFTREEIESLILQDSEIFLVLRENLSGLFDNSTEISVEESTPVKNESPVEIDKIITGAEIESGMHNAVPEPVSVAVADEILPQRESLSEIETSGQPIEKEPEPAYIPEAKIEISDKETGIEKKEDDFSLTEEDIQELESTVTEELPSEETILQPEPPILTDDEAISAALSGQSFDEIIPANNKNDIDDIFIKSAPDELIMHIEEKTEAPIDETDFLPPYEPVKAAEGDTIKEQSENRTIEHEIHESEPEQKIIPALSSDNTGGEMNKQEVKKIIQAMELVNSNVKIDDLLSSIVNVATDLTNADRGTLYLVDKEKGELWSKVAMGTEPKEIRLKIGEGIAGNVAKTKILENIKDVNKHPMFKKDVDKSSGYVTKNMLCFPLINKEEEVIGVLQLLNNKNGEFTEQDEEALSMISINTAIALQNAELVEKLLTAERVSSLGKMTNFLIQDIKKPVLVSKRYTEHLKSKSLTPEISQLVDMILAELTQVADLVQTTSSYAEGKTILRTTITGINTTLQDFISRIEQYVVSKHCKINFEPDKEINVKIDSKEFYQCFQHIIKNACDAMPDSGTVTVKTRIADKSVKIIFEDHGLGIPESFIDKIFEPFMTHGKKEGSGLGLSITKKIVEAHQGTIEVRSALGAGAVFTITLPAGSAL